MRGQLEDVLWRSRPKDQTVPMVLKARLNAGILQPQQVGVNGQLLEVGRQELVPLLSISCRAMCSIQGLDLRLKCLY